MRKAENPDAWWIIAEEPKNLQFLEHLRMRRSELREKAASVINFNGFLLASFAVFAGDDAAGVATGRAEFVATLAGGFFLALVSVLSAYGAANTSGRYPAGLGAEEYLAEFNRMNRVAARAYQRALRLSLLAMMAIVVHLALASAAGLGWL